MTEEITSINKILQVLEQNKEYGKQEVRRLQKKIDIIKDFKSGKPVIAIDVLNLVCYRNIGYCCGLTKHCIWRDTVLNIFGVTAEEYVTAKDKCQKELLKNKLVQGHK